MECEVWKAVVGYEGLYEVSNYGLVRGIDRYVVQLGGTHFVSGRLLKQQVQHKGYHQVTLCRMGVHKTISVHLLVLEAFVGPRPSGMQGCHNDGDTHNNCLENLRWDTAQSNAADIDKHGRRVIKLGEDHPISVLTDDRVREIRTLYATGEWTIRDLAEKFDAGYSTVRYAVKRLSWGHVA